MNVDRMRAIDKWLGIPLTLILTISLRCIHLFKQCAACTPRKILFIELSEMGSTILADPAMRKLKNIEGTELFFVIFKKNRGSLDLIGTIEPKNTFTIRENSLFSLITDTVRFLFWTRKISIDTVIDLELFSRFTALLSGLCGAVNRVGFYSFHNEGLYRGELLTHKVSYNPHMHIAKNFIALINSLLSETPEIPFSKRLVTDEEISLPVISYPEKELESMRAIIKNYYLPYNKEKQKIVLINPNASELLPQRRWDRRNYIELIKIILQEYEDVVILLTGAPSEKDEAQDMTATINNERCVNFAGALKLGQLPILYTISTLMVTNDSGPGHFSSITPMPTFVLFGPETPSLYGSLGNSTPIYAGLACSPCVSAANHRKTACHDNKCLQIIKVKQVFETIKPVLAQV